MKFFMSHKTNCFMFSNNHLSIKQIKISLNTDYPKNIKDLPVIEDNISQQLSSLSKNIHNSLFSFQSVIHEKTLSAINKNLIQVDTDNMLEILSAFISDFLNDSSISVKVEFILSDHLAEFYQSYHNDFSLYAFTWIGINADNNISFFYCMSDKEELANKTLFTLDKNSSLFFNDIINSNDDNASLKTHISKNSFVVYNMDNPFTIPEELVGNKLFIIDQGCYASGFYS